MEIIVDIARSPQGHLTGTARPATGTPTRRHFHGVMELLACLERIVDIDVSIPDTPHEGETTMSEPIEFPSLPQADQDTITTTLLALSSAFRERDVNQLADVYTVDADWVNAFGTVKRKRRDRQLPPRPLRRRELQRRHPPSTPRDSRPCPHPRSGTGLRSPPSRGPEAGGRR